MIRHAGALLLLFAPVAAFAADDPDARTIVARAYAAAGGDGWAHAKTLVLAGRAVFYAPDAAAPKTVADDYRMWRAFEETRDAAHGESGSVRIDAHVGPKRLFLVGSDGTASFDEKGPIPKDRADAFWASNFGFGVIRHALKPGFALARLPDDDVGGHPVYMVRVTDPAGTTTLFGVDRATSAIRLAGFATPKGWHVRTYDDFIRLKSPDWLQARHVTLYYNGVKANEVFWTTTTVDAALDPVLFKAP